MQEFLNNVFSGTEDDQNLKVAILHGFNRLSERRIALLQRLTLDERACLELQELCRSLKQIEAILHAKTSSEQKLAEFGVFLANREKSIQKTRLNQNYCPTLPMTVFCCSLEKLLKFKSNDKNACAVKFSRPTLKCVTAMNDELELESLDDLPPGNYVLDEAGEYPLCFETLVPYFDALKEGNPDARKVFLLNKYKMVQRNGAERRVGLSDQEFALLVNYSKESRELNRALKNYLKIIKTEDGELSSGLALQKLSEMLRAGGVSSGGGREGLAGKISEKAINFFQDFVDTLSEEDQKTLFSLPARDVFGPKTFGSCWDTFVKEGTCVEEMAKIVDQVRIAPLSRAFLFRNKKASIDAAEKNYHECVARFNSCLAGERSFTEIICPHEDSSEEISAMLALYFSADKDDDLYKRPSVAEATQKYISRDIVLKEMIKQGDTKVFEIVLAQGTRKIEELFALFFKNFNFMHPPVDPCQFLKLFLSCGFDIESFRLKNDISLLRWAANEGYDKILEFLLAQPIKNGLYEQECQKILEEAIKNKKFQLVNLIKEKQPYVLVAALGCAAWRGQQDIAEALLQLGVDVNASDRFDRKPLFYAVMQKQLGMVRFLLDKGADINTAGMPRFDNTVVMIAAETDSSILEELINRNPTDINQQNNRGQSPLIAAVRAERLDCVKLLIAKKCKIDLKDKSHKDALSYAVENNRQEIVHILIEAEVAEILQGQILRNFRFDNGDTLLHWAVKNNKVEMVRFLLEKDEHGFLSLDCFDVAGNLPIVYAAERGNLDMVKLFLEKNAFSLCRHFVNKKHETRLLDITVSTKNRALFDCVVKATTWQGKTYVIKGALKAAFEAGSDEFIAELISLVDAKEMKELRQPEKEGAYQYLNNAGSYTNAKDAFSAILAFAYEKRNKAILKALMNSEGMQFLRIKADSRNTAGKTWLMEAIENNDPEMVKLLLDHTNDIDELDHEGNTPAVYAARHGNSKILEMLLKKEPSLMHKRNKNEASLLSIAVSHKKVDCVTYLLGKPHSSFEPPACLFQAMMGLDLEYWADIEIFGKLMQAMGHDKRLCWDFALHVMRGEGDPKLLKELLEHYPDLSQQRFGLSNQTILEIATAENKHSYLEILRELRPIEVQYSGTTIDVNDPNKMQLCFDIQSGPHSYDHYQVFLKNGQISCIFQVSVIGLDDYVPPSEVLTYKGVTSKMLEKAATASIDVSRRNCTLEQFNNDHPEVKKFFHSILNLNKVNTDAASGADTSSSFWAPVQSSQLLGSSQRQNIAEVAQVSSAKKDPVMN